MKLKHYLIALLLIPTLSFAQKGTPVDDQKNSFSEQERVEYLKNMPLHGFFGFTFSNSVPQKEYMDNLKTSGPGFGLYGGYRMDPIPVTFGGSADLHFFGSETRYFENRINDWTFSKDTLTTTNLSIPLSVFARLEPNLMTYVFPYLEIGVGFTLLSASADYKSAYFGDAEDKNEFNAYLHYYFGAGVMFKIVDFVMLPNKNTRMLLDIRFKYLTGNETDYYTAKAQPDRSVKFDKYHSKIDQVLFNLGIAFHF